MIAPLSVALGRGGGGGGGGKWHAATFLCKSAEATGTDCIPGAIRALVVGLASVVDSFVTLECSNLVAMSF